MAAIAGAFAPLIKVYAIAAYKAHHNQPQNITDDSVKMATFL